MNAALKEMLTPRKPCELKLTALEDSGPGNLNSRKASGAFGNSLLSSIEGAYKTSTKLRDFSESVGLATLVDGAKDGSFLHCHRVRFKVPVRIWSPISRLRK